MGKTNPKNKGVGKGNAPETKVHNFKPGRSGNPTGKPKGFKGLAASIQINTDSGQELMEFALQVMRGTHKTLRATGAQRIWACQWLADRGFGKAATVVEILAPDSSGPKLQELDFKKMSDADLLVLEQAGHLISGNILDSEESLEDENPTDDVSMMLEDIIDV